MVENQISCGFMLFSLLKSKRRKKLDLSCLSEQGLHKSIKDCFQRAGEYACHEMPEFVEGKCPIRSLVTGSSVPPVEVEVFMTPEPERDQF